MSFVLYNKIIGSIQELTEDNILWFLDFFHNYLVLLEIIPY